MAFALFSTLKTFRLFSPTAVLPLQGTAAVVERSQSPPRAALPEVAPVIAPLPAAERTLPAPEPERRPPAPPSGRWAPSLEPPPPRSCAAGRGWFSWGGPAAAAAAETEGKICFRNDPHGAEKHRFIHFNSIISNLSMSVIINKTRIWCFESITVITNNKKCCFKLKDHISHFFSFFIKSQTVIHENGHGGAVQQHWLLFSPHSCESRASVLFREYSHLSELSRRSKVCFGFFWVRKICFSWYLKV